MMSKIKEWDWVTFDNGLRCLINKSDKQGYDYYINYYGFQLNHIKEYYLDDAIKFGQKVCLQRLDNNDLEYVYIVAVNDKLI